MQWENVRRNSSGFTRHLAVLVLAGATVAGIATGAVPSTSAQAAGPPSDGPRAELRGLIENVTQATGRRYQATDSAGRTMDGAKIIEDSPGNYLAVYHTLRSDRRFHASVATSTDLLNWTFAHDFASGSSQPTIAKAPDGGYVVAWEQDPSNHVSVHYYPTRAALLAGTDTRRRETSRSLSSCAEGTPNIYSIQFSPDVDHSTITIGGHYYANCDVDRQLKGTLTNFSSWSAKAQPNVDNAMLYWGVKGNIGDRDQVTFRNFPYGLFEGQFTKGDFGSWRPFLYDYQTGNADKLAIHTDQGSTAFANPAITDLHTPDGKPAILVSLFVPAQGSAFGEAGQLLYYRTY